MTLENVKKIIEEALPGSKAYILDPMNDGQHLQAFVVSADFEGMMLVKQHQLVLKPLKQTLAEEVHALALKTFTPRKWNEIKAQYGF